MVDAVKRAGGKIQYTEYEGVPHNSWDKAYDDPEAIKWLLSQHKGR
jgi:predicted peptidase